MAWRWMVWLGLSFALGCGEPSEHHTGMPAPIWISSQVSIVGDSAAPVGLGEAVPAVPDPPPPAEKVEGWIRQGERFHALRFELLDGAASLWGTFELGYAGARPLWAAALQALSRVRAPSGMVRTRLDPARCRTAAQLAMAAGRLQQPVLPLGRWQSGSGFPSGGFGGLSGTGALCVVARLGERRAEGEPAGALLDDAAAVLALEAQARGAVGWQRGPSPRLNWPAPVVLLLGTLPDLSRAEPAVAQRFIERSSALLRPIAEADRAAVQQFVDDGQRWLPFATANQLARLPGIVVPEVERRRKRLVHAMGDLRVPVLWRNPSKPLASDEAPHRLHALLRWMVAQRASFVATGRWPAGTPPTLGPWRITHRVEGPSLYVTVKGLDLPLQGPRAPAPQHVCALKDALLLRLGPGDASWPAACARRSTPMADPAPSAAWAQAATALAERLAGATDPQAAGFVVDGSGWLRDTPLGPLRLARSEAGWPWSVTLGEWDLPIVWHLDGLGTRLWAEYIARTATPATRWAALELFQGRSYGLDLPQADTWPRWPEDDPRWGRLGLAERPSQLARAPTPAATLSATVRGLPAAIRAVAAQTARPDDPYLAVLDWRPVTVPWPTPEQPPGSSGVPRR